MEILAVSKISSGRVYVPTELKERFNLKDGEKVVWKYDRQTDSLILETPTKKDSKDYISGYY